MLVNSAHPNVFMHSNPLDATASTTNMTGQFISDEWNYRVQERLGILCGTDEPTPEQREMAEKDANNAIRELKREDK